MARRKPTSTGVPAAAFMAQGFNGGTREPKPSNLPENHHVQSAARDLLAACEAVVAKATAIINGADKITSAGASQAAVASILRECVLPAIRKAKGGAA